MKITKSHIVELLNEELTKTDKSEIKKMIRKYKNERFKKFAETILGEYNG